jgi:triosephosphate isomerase
MTRTPVLAANWKMHKTIKEAVSFTEAFLPKVAMATNAQIVIAPPFTALARVSSVCNGTNVVTAGQNMHEESHGAFTGELSASMLKEAGASHVIIGHSERRHSYGETDAGVNRKIQASLDAGLVPIVCIGETLEQREREQTHTVLTNQLTKGLTRLSEKSVAQLILAYEPVWAIGTGQTASPEQAQDAHRYIRNHLTKLTNSKIAEQCRLLYGGSVKPTNAAELAAQTDVDGALVGGASLDPNSFADIVLESVQNI